MKIAVFNDLAHSTDVARWKQIQAAYQLTQQDFEDKCITFLYFRGKIYTG